MNGVAGSGGILAVSDNFQFLRLRAGCGAYVRAMVFDMGISTEREA